MQELDRDVVIVMIVIITIYRPATALRTPVRDAASKYISSSFSNSRLPGLRDLSCPQRRKMLNLDTLELSRLHFDLIMCYKIVFNTVVTRCHP